MLGPEVGPDFITCDSLENDLKNNMIFYVRCMHVAPSNLMIKFRLVYLKQWIWIFRRIVDCGACECECVQLTVCYLVVFRCYLPHQVLGYFVEEFFLQHLELTHAGEQGADWGCGGIQVDQLFSFVACFGQECSLLRYKVRSSVMITIWTLNTNSAQSFFLTYVGFERQLIQGEKNVAETSQVQTHQTLLEMISQFSHKWYIPSLFLTKSF